MEICKRCKYKSTCSAASYSDVCLNYEPRPLTNADRIRAMSDEELSKWISDNADTLCPPKDSYCTADCALCWLEWLKEEAEEDE